MNLSARQLQFLHYSEFAFLPSSVLYAQLLADTEIKNSHVIHVQCDK